MKLSDFTEQQQREIFNTYRRINVIDPSWCENSIHNVLTVAEQLSAWINDEGITCDPTRRDQQHAMFIGGVAPLHMRSVVLSSDFPEFCTTRYFELVTLQNTTCKAAGEKLAAFVEDIRSDVPYVSDKLYNVQFVKNAAAALSLEFAPHPTEGTLEMTHNFGIGYLPELSSEEEKQIDELWHWSERVIMTLARMMKDEIVSHYDQVTSDDAVRRTLVMKEYDFTPDGKISASA